MKRKTRQRRRSKCYFHTPDSNGWKPLGNGNYMARKFLSR